LNNNLAAICSFDFDCRIDVTIGGNVKTVAADIVVDQDLHVVTADIAGTRGREAVVFGSSLRLCSRYADGTWNADQLIVDQDMTDA